MTWLTQPPPLPLGERRTAEQPSTNRFLKIFKIIGMAVAAIARERDVPRAQIALAWVLDKPEASAPNIGVSKISHLEDAIAALAITLTDDEIDRLEAPIFPMPSLVSNSATRPKSIWFLCQSCYDSDTRSVASERKQ